MAIDERWDRLSQEVPSCAAAPYDGRYDRHKKRTRHDPNEVVAAISHFHDGWLLVLNFRADRESREQPLIKNSRRYDEVIAWNMKDPNVAEKIGREGGLAARR